MDNFFVMDHHLHNEGHPHQPHVKTYHPRADPTNLLIVPLILHSDEREEGGENN